MIAEQDFAGRQSRGARQLQEDAYAFLDFEETSGETGLLLVLADGMGGHNAGERASELAVKSFVAAFHHAEGTTARRLQKALTVSNEAIAGESRAAPECEGMGTTLLAASITTSGLEWVSVGDSPLYLWRAGKLQRLNADHSLRPVLKEMSDRRENSSHRGASHASGNILRAALTGQEIALIDRSAAPVKQMEGDIILAASDGVHTLNDSEIMEACGSTAAHASDLAENLVRALLDIQNPRQDNITVAVVKSAATGDDLALPL